MTTGKLACFNGCNGQIDYFSYVKVENTQEGPEEHLPWSLSLMAT